MDDFDSDGESDMHGGTKDAWLTACEALVQDSSISAYRNSWKIKGRANAGDTFTLLSDQKDYDGFGMVSVFGGVAFQIYFVRPLALTQRKPIKPSIAVIDIRGKRRPSPRGHGHGAEPSVC